MERKHVKLLVEPWPVILYTALRQDWKDRGHPMIEMWEIHLQCGPGFYRFNGWCRKEELQSCLATNGLCLSDAWYGNMEERKAAHQTL